MYFLLTGHPPFPDGSISERLLKHQMEQAPTIFKDRHDAPSLMVNICNRMMAKRPEERFQTADEVSESLVEWLNDRGLSPGDSGRKLGSGGVGSDVFKRFSAALAKAGGDSKGKMTPGSPGSGAPISRMPEEEIGLAPLEEETPKESREIAQAEEAK